MNTRRDGSDHAPDDVVGRVAVVLRALAQGIELTTSAVAAATGIPRPSTHRLLGSLAGHGLVDRDPETGRWALGPEAFLLSNAAATHHDLRALAYPYVRKLADMSEESAFFSIRRGNETVCLIREDGAFPIRSHVLFEGARFPLGVVSAGLAILAYLRDAEIAAYLDASDLSADYGPAHARDALDQRLEETRGVGWAVNPGLVVSGSWGMASAVFDADQRPIAALTLTGIESRFTERRRRELGPMLLRAAHSLTKALRDRGVAPRN